MNGHKNSTTNSTECSESWEELPKTNKKPLTVGGRMNRKPNQRKNRRNRTTIPDASPLLKRTQTRWIVGICRSNHVRSHHIASSWQIGY